jgi:hypothetical protein
MVSMVHGFRAASDRRSGQFDRKRDSSVAESDTRVHQNLNRPTSKANERTVNQQKTSILSGEAALHKIAKQFYIGTFFACMCLRPQKH